INECNTNSKCSNTPIDDSVIVDNPVGNSVEMTGDENSVNQGIQSSNDCNFSTCDNKADLEAEILGSRNILVQQAGQHNNCSDSEGPNEFDQFFLAYGDNNRVIVKGDQSNTCGFSSDCLNHVGFAFGGG